MGIETAIKRATRKVSQAVTGEETQVDLLDTLKEEHEEVTSLLKQVVASKSGAERNSLRKVLMELV